jgi:hypothetical protein
LLAASIAYGFIKNSYILFLLAAYLDCFGFALLAGDFGWFSALCLFDIKIGCVAYISSGIRP